MTAPAGPHFLNLPREIRDEIYHYLSQEINLRWGRCEEPRDYWNQASVRLRDVPLSSVLLTSAQLHDEYLESFRRQPLSVTINIGVYSSLDTQDGEPKKLADDPVVERIFARVQEVTVIFELDFDSYGMWRDVHDLLNTMSSKLPHISTVRVIAHYSNHYTGMYCPEEHCGVEKFYRPPIKSLLHLPLRQRGAGYFWDYCDFSDAYPTGDDGLTVPAAQRLNHQYLENTVGAWLYSKDESDKDRVLPIDFYDKQTITRPSPESLNAMPEAEAKIAARIGLGFEVWKEARGKDLWSWGPLDENLKGYGGTSVQF